MQITDYENSQLITHNSSLKPQHKKMKKIILLTTATLLLFACGDKKEASVEELITAKNLIALKERKSAMMNEHNQLLKTMAQIDEAILQLDSNQNLPVVTVFSLEEQKFYHYVELQGSVQTKENIVIFPEYAGILTQVLVKEGQQVSKGQLLAKIDDGGLSQQLAQAETQAALAKTTFERQERLWKEKIGSEMQFLQAKTNHETQQKVVNQLKEQLERTLVKAPFSGVIDDVISEQGQVVTPGMSQLFRIVNLSNMYAEAEIPENYLKGIKNNIKVEVYLPVLGDTIHSTIRQVGNFINPNNRSFKVEIPLENAKENIKPNLTAILRINDYKNDSSLVIPQHIISENAEGEQYVYVIETNKNKESIAKRKIITTGKAQSGKVEVLSGLTKKQTIVNEGARNVRENQKVVIDVSK